MLDEPTSGLDPLMEQAFRRCVHEARGRGQTVLLSSHILSEVEALCDRVGILRAGRLVEMGTLAEMRHLSALTVEATFDGHGARRLARAGRLHGRGAGRRRALPGARRRRAAAARCSPASRVHELLSREPSLEELFLAHYGAAGERSAAAGRCRLSRARSAARRVGRGSPGGVVARLHGPEGASAPECVWGYVFGLYVAVSGARLRLELQDRGVARASLAEQFGSNAGHQRARRPGARARHRRRLHGVEVPHGARDRRRRLGPADRDQAAARRGGRRALGAAARRPDDRAARRRPGARRPRRRGRWRCSRVTARHHRRGRALLEGRHRRRLAMLFFALAMVVGAACSSPSARSRASSPRPGARPPAYAAAVLGAELRAADGGRLGHRPRVAAVGHAARLGRGAPAAHRSRTRRARADRRIHGRARRRWRRPPRRDAETSARAVLPDRSSCARRGSGSSSGRSGSRSARMRPTLLGWAVAIAAYGLLLGMHRQVRRQRHHELAEPRDASSSASASRDPRRYVGARHADHGGAAGLRRVRRRSARPRAEEADGPTRAPARAAGLAPVVARRRLGLAAGGARRRRAARRRRPPGSAQRAERRGDRPADAARRRPQRRPAGARRPRRRRRSRSASRLVRRLAVAYGVLAWSLPRRAGRRDHRT